MKVSKTLLAIAVASTPLMATSVSAVQLEDYLVANSSYDEAYVSGSLTAIEPAGDDPNDQVGYNYSIDADYENQDSLPDDDISATVGLGYGRVYNATPLAKVIRIVEELNEEGLLTGPIPDSVALETAEIIDRIQEFKSKFGEDDYKPDYYAAIEAALGRSGALRDGKFGALGALTADKVLEDEPISTRKHGWVVRLGAGFQASDLSGLTDNDPKLLAQWEYAKPYGYKGQFINLFSFEPVFGDETITKFRNDMSYTHEVTDMIDWINTWSMAYSDGDDANGNALESTNHIVSSRYSFDLGNSLDYFVGLRLNQTDIDPNPPGSVGDDPEIRFESGFNYRLK